VKRHKTFQSEAIRFTELLVDNENKGEILKDFKNRFIPSFYTKHLLQPNLLLLGVFFVF